MEELMRLTLTELKEYARTHGIPDKFFASAGKSFFFCRLNLTIIAANADTIAEICKAIYFVEHRPLIFDEEDESGQESPPDSDAETKEPPSEKTLLLPDSIIETDLQGTVLS
ncbi:MAG: hypothetical protein ACHQ1H_07165 [Nitrososphaerales archaeon]